MNTSSRARNWLNCWEVKSAGIIIILERTNYFPEYLTTDWLLFGHSVTWSFVYLFCFAFVWHQQTDKQSQFSSYVLCGAGLYLRKSFRIMPLCQKRVHLRSHRQTQNSPKKTYRWQISLDIEECIAYTQHHLPLKDFCKCQQWHISTHLLECPKPRKTVNVKCWQGFTANQHSRSVLERM